MISEQHFAEAYSYPLGEQDKKLTSNLAQANAPAATIAKVVEESRGKKVKTKQIHNVIQVSVNFEKVSFSISLFQILEF